MRDGMDGVDGMDVMDGMDGEGDLERATLCTERREHVQRCTQGVPYERAPRLRERPLRRLVREKRAYL